MKGILLAIALLFPLPAAAQAEPGDNADIAAIFAADQAIRSGARIDMQEMLRADAERRALARELFEQGALSTANDYYAAAFVFQHGASPDDFLLAHVLAMRSLALGRKEAEWIATATLDRYLQNIGKSQIYGTQFNYAPETGATMEPYDRALLTDALRVAVGAHTVAEQEAQLGELAATMKAMVEGANP